MGILEIPLRAFFRRVNVDFVTPPKNSKRTLSLGVRYAPEFACLPLKITLGNFIEALETGADTIAMAGASGPCRFGLYGIVQAKILEKLGYKFKLILVNQDENTDIKTKIKELAGNASWLKIIPAVFWMYAKLRACEFAEELSFKTRAYELNPGDTTKAFKEALSLIEKAESYSELRETRKKIRALFDSIPKDKNREVLYVGTFGEIYLMLEPFANHFIEEKLGDHGVVVTRAVTLSGWLKELVHLDWFGNFARWRLRRVAKPYLSCEVGGEGIVSVGSAITFARLGYDGVVHISPFTCMPEIVAKSILTKVCKDYDLPLLDLTFDEHTGEAGLITRIEAFVDLLRRRRKYRLKPRNSAYT